MTDPGLVIHLPPALTDRVLAQGEIDWAAVVQDAIEAKLAAIDLAKRLEHAPHGAVKTRERHTPVTEAVARVQALRLPGPE